MNKRVLVGISGGMDSAVAAGLLKTQGFDVAGAFIQIWDQAQDSALQCSRGSCCMIRDSAAAKKVCKQLEIPFYEINARDQYQAEVLDYIVHEAIQGRSPNPCAVCNTGVKIANLLKKADELKIDYVATGHYAKIVRTPGGSETNLSRAADSNEDQSYFLFGLNQAQLSRILMPVGDLLATNILKMAATFELPMIEKNAKCDICFMDDLSYRAMIEARAVERYRISGPVVTQEGHILSRHEGLYKYSLGQHKGVELDDDPDHAAYCVVGFDPKVTALIVGPKELLMKNGLLAANCNWIGQQDFSKGMKTKAKLSPKSEVVACHVTLLNNNSVQVDFEEPQHAIPIGQPIVFYYEDLVIGGGWIEALTDPISTKLRGRGK